jgi:hypothetical protein
MWFRNELSSLAEVSLYFLHKKYWKVMIVALKNRIVVWKHMETEMYSI